MTSARYRRRAGQRWYAGRLRTVGRYGDDPRRFTVELIDNRTGAWRTLDTARHEVEVADGRWIPINQWAHHTTPLFTLGQETA